MMKNKIMPVKMSATLWLRSKAVAICPAPHSRKTMRKVVSTIIAGLNLASHETIIAVKPIPPAEEVVMEWSTPETIRKPHRPQSPPESAIVRIITFLTLMPT